MSFLHPRLSVTALLVVTIGTTAACSSGSSSHTAAKSSSGQASAAQNSSASTPAWLVNGKVDISKLGNNDTPAACDKLLGSAKDAAYLAKIDDQGDDITHYQNFAWNTTPAQQSDRVDGNDATAYASLMCRPIAVDDNSLTLPGIVIDAYMDAKQGRFTIPVDPTFGTGPTKVAYVGRAMVHSKFTFTDGMKLGAYNTDDSVGSGDQTLPNGYSVSKQEWINHYKATNAATAAVTAPLIDRAAQHVYGG